MLLTLSAQTLPALTMWAWLGIAYPLLTLSIWAALGQWIIMRPKKFERDTFCFGCLVSRYLAWHAFWTTLVACPFVPVATLVFSLLTAQLMANWRVYKDSSEKGPRIIEEFHTMFQLELETQRLIRTKHICKWRRKVSGDVLTGKTHHDQLKRGSSFSVPVACSYVEMSLSFKRG